MAFRGVRFAATLLVCLLALVADRAALADCALIPAALKVSPSNDGAVDTPFAAPGDTVTVLSDGACKPADNQPHFDPVAVNNEITLIFDPPTGAVPPAVAPFPATNVLSCGEDRCFAVEFVVPDTTGLAGSFPLTGPARIEVRNNAAGGALVAVIEELFEPTRGCNPQNRARSIHQQFTVLPPRNLYSENPSASLNATVAGDGSLLIPLDFTNVLASAVGSGSGTVRILSITADLPNGLSGGNGLAGPDANLIRLPRFGRFVRAFSSKGRPIPPLLKVSATQPLSTGGVEYGDTIVGSVDFVDSVLRIAKVAEDPSSPGTPLQIFALDGEQGQAGLTLQNGVGSVVLNNVSLEAGAAAPLNSVASSQELAVVARDERLEQAFGTGNQNGDGDADDKVVHFIDLGTDTEVTTNMAVSEAEAKAILASGGTTIAFFQSELHQNRSDFNTDGDFQDPVLRVWNADGSHPFCGGSACELTAGLPAAVGYPLTAIRSITGRPSPVAISGVADPDRYVFFARHEPGDAPLATQRLSLRSTGAQTSEASRNPALDFTGLNLVYTSDDDAIVSGLTGTGAASASQIYAYQTQVGPGSNRLISTTSHGSSNGANGNSDNATVTTTDGGTSITVGFESLATNLVAGDTEGFRDVFVSTDQFFMVLRASQTSGVGGNGPSRNPHIADDASGLVYETDASNLVTGDTNGATDILFFDASLTNTRVSLTNSGGQANGASTRPRLDGDSSRVVFQSAATNLVAGDTNGVVDVFLRDVAAGTTTRISRGNAGAQANGASTDPDIDNAGRWVVFASSATNLLPPGTTLNDPTQCYLHDTVRRKTILVSVNLSGESANAPCLEPEIDASGRFVAFTTTATNFDASASTSSLRTHIFDRVLGYVLIAAGDAATDLPTAGPTGTRSDIAGSLQGILVFDSSAADYGVADTNGVFDVYGQLNQFGPNYNTGGPYADTDNGDQVLFVFDTVNRTFVNTQIPVGPAAPIGDVAVAGGRAAIASSHGGQAPVQGVIWDQEAGGQLRVWGPATAQAIRVAISETTFCAVAFDGVSSVNLFVGDPASGQIQNTGLTMSTTPLPTLKAIGDRCIVTDSSGVLQIATRTGGTHSITNTGLQVRDFQVGDEGIAAEVCEADTSTDLNFDNDMVDCVMHFWDFTSSPPAQNTQHVVIACTFPGCDPFFEPWRVGPGIISFVTSESQEVDTVGATGGVGSTCLPTSPPGVCDKTGDEDGNDVAVEIYNRNTGRAQVFPIDVDNPPDVDIFPKVTPGSQDNVLVIQLPAEILGDDFSSLPGDQLVTVIVGDPEGDGVFEADGNTDVGTAVTDKCQELANPNQVDADGDGMGAGCDVTLSGAVANDDPNTSPEPALIPGTSLCDLNLSGTITRTEVNQIWSDRGTPISAPVDHIVPLDQILDPTDDRDWDADGEVTAVDFRQCLIDCENQAGGCPLVEGGQPGWGTCSNCGMCGLLGFEVLVVLLPWARRRRLFGSGRRSV